MYSVASNTTFVLESNPGIPAYGQQGRHGYTGEPGSSIYFTMLSDASTKTEIRHKNPLFGPMDGSVNYKVGDLIMNVNGNINRIDKITSSSVTLTKYGSVFQTQEFNEISSLTVTNVTDTMNAYETLSYIQENPYYIQPYDQMTSSKFLYHRDRYFRGVAGLWLKFECVHSSDVSNLKYKYILRFPNGMELIKCSNDPVDYMFVDVRFFNECYAGYKHGSTSHPDISILRGAANSNGVTESGETSTSLINTILSEEMIGANSKCVAEVEVENISTNKIYRVKAGSITA